MNDTLQKECPKSIGNSDLEAWFDDYIEQLRVHQLMIEKGCAPAPMEQFYSSMAEKDFDGAIKSQLPFINKYMIKNSLQSLFNEIGNIIPNFYELALHLSKNKIRVWVVLPDDNDKLDMDLVLKIAKVNSKLHDDGYFIDLYTFEKSDNISIPKHYNKVQIK